MDSIINKLIEQPIIGGYIAVAVIVALVVYFFTKFYIETCRSTKEIPEIRNSLKKIDSGLNTLNKILLENSIIKQSCYASENSPRMVNDLGEKLFNESGAKELFDKIKDDLIKELEANKVIDSLLELERESLNVLLRKMDNQEFRQIQNFAFQHPTYNGNPLNYTDILFIIALKLRDLYSSKHPNLYTTVNENS